MLRQVEGSQAVAEAVALCRPEVICAYPISPQTHIVEALGERVKSGALRPCEFINVESEFAAMSVAIGASAAGARAYTATASQGLLYMAEALFNASGLGLPIVMTVANRAIGAPINIWNDHTDSMSQRDCGWIQLFAENNQEALDLHVQAFRLGEELSLPVMVCMDGFILTHAYEEVDIPDQEQVDAPYRIDDRLPDLLVGRSTVGRVLEGQPERCGTEDAARIEVFSSSSLHSFGRASEPPGAVPGTGSSFGPRGPGEHGDDPNLRTLRCRFRDPRSERQHSVIEMGRQHRGTLGQSIRERAERASHQTTSRPSGFERP